MLLWDKLLPFVCFVVLFPQSSQSMKVAVLKENVWRPLAVRHSQRVWDMLRPGLVTSSSSRNSRLDEFHPVYNFLVEYYGFKGSKGCRRIARWSPPVMQTLMRSNDPSSSVGIKFSPMIVEAQTEAMGLLGNDGVLLENAKERDAVDLIHMRGAKLVSFETSASDKRRRISGALYSPSFHYTSPVVEDGCSTATSSTKQSFRGTFEYFQSILVATLQAEPILFCHGLHEWAMQYQPEGHPPPPSSQYQSHLPFRVDQLTINAAVERRGVYCTHVDALRFFAPAAKSWNHFGEYGTNLGRKDQITLEQPACVHANMDLLKYAVRLSPWIDGDVVGDALEVALKARTLDLASSPYDVSSYGLNPIPIETSQGRSRYRELQAELLSIAKPLRQRILDAYNDFLDPIP